MAEKKSKLVTTAAAAATPRNVIMTSGTTSPLSGQDSASQLFRSNFASSPGGATPTSASTSTSATAAAAFFSRTSSISPTSPTSTIQYDHETYLELLAGKSRSVEKTASQVYREVRLPPRRKSKKKLSRIGTSAQAQSESSGPGGPVGAY